MPYQRPSRSLPPTLLLVLSLCVSAWALGREPALPTQAEITEESAEESTEVLVARAVSQLSYIAADYSQVATGENSGDMQLLAQLRGHVDEVEALLASLPDRPGRGQLTRSLKDLRTAIERRADAETVRRRANTAADRLAALYQLPRSPAELLPTAEEGRGLYRARCSRCHGDAGASVAGTAVNADFADRSRMAGFSLYDLYNAIDPHRDDVHGPVIDGDLSSRQRWALAVVVAGFAAPPRMPPLGLAKRYPGLVVQPGVATVRPAELPQDARQALMWWRAYPQRARDMQHPLTRAAGLLQQAQTAFRGGDSAAAYHQLVLAQREGFAPVSSELEARDPALARQITRQWQDLRQLILSQGPENEVVERFQTLTTAVIRARNQLQPSARGWSDGWAILLLVSAAGVGWLLWIKLLRPRRR
ncbi:MULTISPECIES: c-type cytochrome [Microbulbifer]|uniref:C-type cytochrome n=1 Tax=Microbulbifer celer TaxID=435905 RepID=A0ABW3U8D3_9GAMM|nr:MULTISPECIES: cytochrome c [Microbulbifer]UFN56934.1 cytochrome c [Microbulbifer celer]